MFCNWRCFIPFYDYFCEANQQVVEVKHDIKTHLKTWNEVCELAEIPLGETAPDSPVERLIAAPQVKTTMGDSRLKELGFTKLVKRDKGVYENVTATGHEKKYVKADDPSSMPDFKKKISD